MKHTSPRRTWIALGLVGVVVLAISPSTRGQGSGVQAFTGATLIDGDGARIDNAVLVIRDGRVLSAGRSGAVAIPKRLADTQPARQNAAVLLLVIMVDLRARR